MPRQHSTRDQPGLFGDDTGTSGPIGPAPADQITRDLAAQLPPLIRLGTSSWSFPGWASIVYDRAASTADLARRGLRAYAAHPLMRTVGLDRTFYAPIPAAEFSAYRAGLPAGFSMLVKAWQGLLRPETDTGAPNPTFLDAAYARDQVIAPALLGLGEGLGPVLFQFSPLRLRDARAVSAFITRLDAFLAVMPAGVRTAVEVRNRELLTADLARTLAARGAAFCYSVHPSIPPPAEQARIFDPAAQPALVARWLLGHGRGYEEAKDLYAPFGRIAAPDGPSLHALAGLARIAIASGRHGWIIINNKAEGSAPLSVARLAHAIVNHTQGELQLSSATR